jgi:hypothetical protein
MASFKCTLHDRCAIHFTPAREGQSVVPFTAVGAVKGTLEEKATLKIM